MHGQNTAMSSSAFGTLRARHLGPAIMSGRVTSIDALQSNPLHIYLGTASGGVWKSTNGGVTLQAVFDKHTQSIGDVLIDQLRPDTVWVGTGESWTRNSVSIGTGIYKSTDGGARWVHMGLDSTERIARIIMHPSNPDILYVAALGHLWGDHPQRGLFKTSDGGQSWKKILYVDERTGCCDVDMDPDNPDILYAGMWSFRRRAWDFYSGGDGSGLYKSTDGGKTWKELTNDLPQGEKGRISVRVSPADPDLVYAIVEADQTALYGSRDKGESWNRLNDSPVIAERPFYFCLIVPDPVDTARVYKPGLELQVSEDGGRKFRTTAFTGGRIHADIHDVWISGEDPNYMYAATDGGVYVSNDYGGSWRHFRNLPVAQFYKVSVDMEKPYHVYGGLQDNGSWMAPSASTGGVNNYDWQSFGIGDGFSVHPDPGDSHLIYWQMQGGLFGQTDRRYQDMRLIAPMETASSGKLRFNWDAAIHVSPTAQRIYVGAQYLFKSEDRGSSWERISPDLTTNDPTKQQQAESGGLTVDNSTAENHTTIYCIAESALDDQLIWVGTDDGNLQVTRDGGQTWTNTVDRVPGLPPHTWCSSVYPSRFDPAMAYATFDGHRNDDFASYVYKTTDFGQSWTSLSTDALTAHCYKVLEDLVNPDLLFLGSEFGLFVSVNGGTDWVQFKNELPHVSVMDMVIHPREHDLILGTHGRGVYIIDDISPLRQLSPEVLDADFAFLGQRDPVPYMIAGPSWPVLDDEWVASNPRQAIPVTFYMKKKHLFGTLKAEVFSLEGKRLSELPLLGRKGVNQVYWVPLQKPPRWPRSEAVPFQMRIAMAGGGIEHPPGDYLARVSKGNEMHEDTIRVFLDPESPYTPEEVALKRKYQLMGFALLEDLAFLDRRMTELRAGLEVLTASQTRASMTKKLHAIESELQSLTDRMMITNYGDLRGDERLREEVGFLYGAISIYGGAPTRVQMERMAYLNEKVRAMERDVQAHLDASLKVVNKGLAKAGEEALVLSTRESFDAEVN